ncbi:efflux RND transporter periplasmic adaptor subunit, partial [Azotobacter chroococcum]|nr:efflux RND transporter periplasmic adaptor subunit [Azotobacter chroococcum]
DFLRQGMTVSVNIETGRREPALVLPNDALFERDGSRGAVLRLNDDRVERVAVRLGLRGTALSEVLEGLAPGDRVLAVAAGEGERVRWRERPLPLGRTE